MEAGDVVRICARAHERDRYLAALLSPPRVRPDLIALAAFAGEIGRLPLSLTEPMMARIRLQWWRERIEEGTSGGHPVAAAVIETAQRHGLDRSRLVTLIDAHDDSLDDRPFADQAAMLAHVDRIDGTLFALAQQVVSGTVDRDLTHPAGRAYGLARVCLEVPAAIAHGRMLLPWPPGHKLPRDWPQLAPAIAEVGAVARSNLAACASAMGQLSRAGRSPFLPLALVEPYLQAFEQVTELPDRAVDLNPLQRTWRLWRCRWTGGIV